MAKYFMNLLYWFCLLMCFQVSAVEVVEVVYMNEARVEFEKINDNAQTTVLNVYLSKNKEPNYKIKIASDYQLLDGAIFGDKLVVLLKMHNTYHALIADKKTGKVLDSFWCHFATISPSGRFLVYTRWKERSLTPKYGWDGGITSIYDLTKSPMQNRIKSEQTRLKNTTPSFSNASIKAGIPVFPLGDYNKQGYAMTQNQKKEHNTVYAPYVWYETHAFVFSTIPIGSVTRIVDVKYNQDNDSFAVDVYQLSENILNPQAPVASTLVLIDKIEKAGKGFKLYSANRVIRLSSLKQLPLVE